MLDDIYLSQQKNRAIKSVISFMHAHEQYAVKRLETKDLDLFKQLLRLYNEVFETEGNKIPGDPYLIRLLDRNEFIVFIMTDGKNVFGGLTAYVMPMYHTESAEAYLYDMAVAADHQRRGFGRLLIASLKEYCKTNDISTLFVEAHEEDTHAIDFYHSTGGQAERVVHFNYYTGK